MYSPLVVERRLHQLKQKGINFTPRSVADSLTITDKLTRKIYTEDGELKKGLAHWKSGLTPNEIAFCESEAILCRWDFRYWANRYGFAEKDASEGGGVGPATF